MPSGPVLFAGNQWEPVVWNKSVPKGKSTKSMIEINSARRQGAEIETSKKANVGGNPSAYVAVCSVKKLDENYDTFRHQTISHDFKLALQQARLAKKLSQ